MIYDTGTVALCVAPVVYGLMNQRKKRPNMRKIAGTTGVSAAEREKIEKELRWRKQEQARLAAEVCYMCHISHYIS